MEFVPKLSFEVGSYCRGPEVISVHGNAQVDPSEVLNQVNGKILKAFRTGHLTIIFSKEEANWENSFVFRGQ